MDPKNPNLKIRKTPQYALYQRQNFWKSNDGEVPLFNTGKDLPVPRFLPRVSLV
jgi:hypothetical protein